MPTRLARLTPATIMKNTSKETSFRQAGGVILALALTLLTSFLIGVFAYTDPVYAGGMAKFAVLLGTLAFAVGTGVVISTAIINGIEVVRGISALKVEQRAAEQRLRLSEQARNLGLDAVQRELRPVSLPKRRLYSEAEAEAWSELAAGFQEEHKQQGWR
jgi:hypothetical protein